MARRPNPVPSEQLNLALPLPVYTQLTAHLWSDLEARVPHGAYSRFLTDLLRLYFTEKRLDLAPYLGSEPGALTITGSPQAVEQLTAILKKGTAYVQPDQC